MCTMAARLHVLHWTSVGLIAIGKFARYVNMTYLLLYVADGVWRKLPDRLE